MFICIIKVYAIENIEIDGSYIIPKFEKNVRVYNYFTNKEIVNIKVFPSKNEIVNGSGKIELDTNNKKVTILSSKDGQYIINIFKNYTKDKDTNAYLTNLSIDNYDINFNKDIHDYSININDEKQLDINYEISNDNAYVSIEGNGNFNKSENIITININNLEEYKIHAFKTINTSLIKDTKVYKEMSNTKKEIVIILIVTISCTLVFGFYYFMFIDKSFLKI